MIYKDFKRVRDIDAQIMSLHREMLSLYDEKSQLTTAPSTPTVPQTPLKKQPKVTANSTKQLYETMKLEWEQLGIKVPAYTSIKSKIQKTQLIIEKLTINDELLGDAQCVLIPPMALLVQAMSHKNARSIDIESFNALRIDANDAWQCAVMFDRADRQQVEGVREFTPYITPLQTDLAVLNTGVCAFTAAYLQGLEVADDTTWTMLLADMDASYKTPCARIMNDSLKFTIDDSDGLLGDNYYYPSIMVKA